MVPVTIDPAYPNLSSFVMPMHVWQTMIICLYYWLIYGATHVQNVTNSSAPIHPMCIVQTNCGHYLYSDDALVDRLLAHEYSYSVLSGVLQHGSSILFLRLFEDCVACRLL